MIGLFLGFASLPAAAVTAAASASSDPLVIEGERHVEIVAQPEHVPAIIEAARDLAAGESEARPVLVTIPWRG